MGNLLLLLTTLPFLLSCEVAQKIERRARLIRNAQKTAFMLAQENRKLKGHIARMNFELQALKSKNNYLSLQIDKKEGDGRKIASISPRFVVPKSDLVKFKVYRWGPSDMLNIARKEFEKKHYEKSAQYFRAFLHYYPHHRRIDDSLFFQTGVAAFKAKNHHDWTLNSLGHLLARYPNSNYYRPAKLWMALTYLQQGKEKKFFSIIEEFRQKYRHTPEWTILLDHYGKITQKYK